MDRRILQFLLMSVFLLGCSAGLPLLENASTQYKHDKDFASLKIIHSKLFIGMQRKEVERLLGEPDYSPIDGQHYYSSAQSVYSEDQEREVVFGMVVDYREGNGSITETLQNFWLGSIGE